jgi:hypothetical protein
MGVIKMRRNAGIVEKTMKGLLIVILTSMFGNGAYAQDAAQDDGGNNKSQLEDVLLNDFEDAEDWRAFSTSPLGDTKIKKVVQIGSIEDVYNPNELTDEEAGRFKEGENHILGVKTYFVDRGFDRVEVKPPHEYIISGTGRQLSVWVLGRQFRHTLYAKLRDYRGKVHKLRFGRLDFFGWRKLTMTIPGWLPQSTRYALLDKNLHFVSLFTVSDEKEVPGTFYFYVDDLRMKVDTSEANYPGSQIKDVW